MSPTLGLVLLLIALIAAVVLSSKTHINAGLFAWVFAWFIGSFGANISASKVIGYFPTNVVTSLMLVSLAIYTVSRTGAMTNMANHVIYSCRNATWAIIPAVFLVSILLSLMGPTAGALMPILMGFGYPIAFSAGLNLLPLVMAIHCGIIIGTQAPWCITGGLTRDPLLQWFDETTAYNYGVQVWGYAFIASVIIILIYLIFTGGFKKVDISLEKPEPMTANQKKAMGIFVLGIIVSLIPTILGSFGVAAMSSLSKLLSLPAICMLVTMILQLMKVSDCTFKEAIVKGVPWDPIFLLSGMSALIKVASEIGAIDVIVSFLSENVPVVLYAPMFLLFAGVMSMFVDAMYTLYPMLVAVAVPVALNSGASVGLLIAACVVGARVTAISPFSTGGSMALGLCTNEEWLKDNKLFNLLIFGAFGTLGIACVLILIAGVLL